MSVSGAIERNRARTPRYREESDRRLEPFEQIARIVIARPAVSSGSRGRSSARGWERRIGHSRVESGQHPTSSNTLRRLASALDGRAPLGFEFERGQTELIAP